MKKRLTLLMFCCFAISFSQETQSPLFSIERTAGVMTQLRFLKPNPFVASPLTMNTIAQLDAIKVNALLPKIDFSEKKTYYFKNYFTDNYNSYIFYGGQLVADKNYISQYEIAPNCNAYYRPSQPANSGDIAGALLSGLVDNMNLKFRLFGNSSVTFE